MNTDYSELELPDMSTREFKDRLFKIVFSEREMVLELYEDLTGERGYTVDDINIFDAINMHKFINDLTFTVFEKLFVIAEHQSTPNQNMPLRALLSAIIPMYAGVVDNTILYTDSKIEIPVPYFYVLYNGPEPWRNLPDDGKLRLSSLFMEKTDAPNLEVVVQVIDIAYHRSSINLDNKRSLGGYSYLIHKIRDNMVNKGQRRDIAIRRAIQECIEEGILPMVLNDKYERIMAIINEDFDNKAYIKAVADAAERKGHEEGREELRDGMVLNAIRSGRTLREISEFLLLPLETVQAIADKYEAVPNG